MSEATRLFRNCLLAFLGLLSPASAQQNDTAVNDSSAGPPVAATLGKGHIQFVNATGRDGALRFMVNGEVLSQLGYPSGRSSGAMPVRERPIKIGGKLLPFKDAELELGVKSDHLHLIIATIEIEEKKDKPPVEKMVLKHFEFPPSNGASPSVLLVIQMTNVPVLNVTFGGMDLTLDHAKPQVLAVTKAMGVFPSIVFRNTALQTFNYHEADHKAVVLFTDKQGGLRTASFGTELK
jgi:hypothetical protein